MHIKGCLKGCLLFAAIIIFIIAITGMIIYEKRRFINVGNRDFTCWNCYILPYKYKGLTPPKKNYLLTYWGCIVDIYIDSDSTLHILGDRTSRNNKEDVPIVVHIHLDSTYKYTYFQSEANKEQEYENYFMLYSLKGFPRFSWQFGDLGH